MLKQLFTRQREIADHRALFLTITPPRDAKKNWVIIKRICKRTPFSVFDVIHAYGIHIYRGYPVTQKSIEEYLYKKYEPEQKGDAHA